jgi:hypothetical protein
LSTAVKTNILRRRLLAKVCKQLRHDVLAFYYGSMTFLFNDPEDDLNL